MKYNYKCVVTKNGNKMFYKNVRGKWKRITNAVGMKATTGKRMYRMDSGPEPGPGRIVRDGRRDLDLQPAGVAAVRDGRRDLDLQPAGVAAARNVLHGLQAGDRERRQIEGARVATMTPAARADRAAQAARVAYLAPGVEAARAAARERVNPRGQLTATQAAARAVVRREERGDTGEESQEESFT